MAVDIKNLDVKAVLVKHCRQRKKAQAARTARDAFSSKMGLGMRSIFMVSRSSSADALLQKVLLHQSYHLGHRRRRARPYQSQHRHSFTQSWRIEGNRTRAWHRASIEPSTSGGPTQTPLYGDSRFRSELKDRPPGCTNDAAVQRVAEIHQKNAM